MVAAEKRLSGTCKVKPRTRSQLWAAAEVQSDSGEGGRTGKKLRRDAREKLHGVWSVQNGAERVAAVPLTSRGELCVASIRLGPRALALCLPSPHFRIRRCQIRGCSERQVRGVAWQVHLPDSLAGLLLSPHVKHPRDIAYHILTTRYLAMLLEPVSTRRHAALPPGTTRGTSAARLRLLHPLTTCEVQR